MKKQLIILVLVCLVAACKDTSSGKGNTEKISDPEDYNSFLNTQIRPTLDEAMAVQIFWSKRLNQDTTGVGDIGPLAAAYESLFKNTGDVRHLYAAERLYKKGIQVSANNKDGFERGLAHNYISQHRFKEAYGVLKESLGTSSNKRQTKQMLFDAAMEIGVYDEAYSYLNDIKNLSDYNYLIRLSKWSDHKGDLESAITYMEKAKGIADSRDSKPLKIWTYSNLADYYGHAGRIKESYQLCLETLKLAPDNAYVKKSIAWIVYAGEQDSSEAHRILDSVMVNHQIPDYFQLKAELYTYEGDTALAEIFTSKYLDAINKGNYGAMYNGYLIELHSERNPAKALELAIDEVANRPTPETYQLLALAYLKNGDTKKALQTIETHVEGKTSEPLALFHSALVYKANDLEKKVEPIKKELQEAAFELGPILLLEIDKL